MRNSVQASKVTKPDSLSITISNRVSHDWMYPFLNVSFYDCICNLVLRLKVASMVWRPAATTEEIDNLV